MPWVFPPQCCPFNCLLAFTSSMTSNAILNNISEIEYNVKLIHEHILMWEPYQHIWKVDKEMFLEKYKMDKHPAQDFDELIISYSDLANNVQIQETVNQVGT